MQINPSTTLTQLASVLELRSHIRNVPSAELVVYQIREDSQHRSVRTPSSSLPFIRQQRMEGRVTHEIVPVRRPCSVSHSFDVSGEQLDLDDIVHVDDFDNQFTILVSVPVSVHEGVIDRAQRVRLTLR